MNLKQRQFTKNQKHSIRHYIILLVFLVLGALVVGIAVVFPDKFVTIIHLPREAAIPAIQAEMNSLVEKLVDYNSDNLLERRNTNPVHRGEGRMFSYCVSGLTELIYQSSRPLNEVATNYANLWNVEAEVRLLTQLEPDELWYAIPISDKIQLLLTPINQSISSGNSSLGTPFPKLCQNLGSCYQVGVYYVDPSLQSCSP